MATKRRSGNQRSGNPARRSSAPTAVRAQFVTHAEAEGHPHTGPVLYHPTGPAGGCWTNAYRYALHHGHHYVEGITRMPNGWHAHAWVVTPDGTLIEPTTGYDVAHDYRGWTIDLSHVTAVMGTRALPHSSFLEAGLASGAASWPQLRDRFTSPPPAPGR